MVGHTVASDAALISLGIDCYSNANPSAISVGGSLGTWVGVSAGGAAGGGGGRVPPPSSSTLSVPGGITVTLASYPSRAGQWPVSIRASRCRVRRSYPPHTDSAMTELLKAV